MSEEEDYKTKYLYRSAEFENLRKRMVKDIEQTRSTERAETIRELLPIIDDLERACSAFMDPNAPVDIEVARAGIRSILGKAKATLAAMDVQAFESVGKPFAADLMEAIAKVPTRALPAGQVAAEIAKGYQIGGRLLRPAQVAVAEDEA